MTMRQVVLLLLVDAIVAFSVLPRAATRDERFSAPCTTGTPGLVVFSGTSDSSDDYWDEEIVDIEDRQASGGSGSSSESAADSTAIKVGGLLGLMPNQVATGDVSAETRAAINEAIVQLERCNPTKDPTVSPLINGVWDLRYAGGYAAEGALASPTRQLALFLYSGGYSPGLFVLSTLQKLLPPGSNLLELQNLEITISRSQPRVTGSVKFSIGPNQAFVGTAKVISRLETMSTVRMKETYESASFQDFDALEIPPFLQYSRDIYVTYVDEDLLIIRDASGVPEVLVRQEKQFSQRWGPEPSEVDDMSPPGEQ